MTYATPRLARSTQPAVPLRSWRFSRYPCSTFSYSASAISLPSSAAGTLPRPLQRGGLPPRRERGRLVLEVHAGELAAPRLDHEVAERVGGGMVPEPVGPDVGYAVAVGVPRARSRGEGEVHAQAVGGGEAG